MSASVATFCVSLSEADVRHNQTLTLRELYDEATALIEAERLSQAEVARRCGLTRQAIHAALKEERIEQGDHSLSAVLGKIIEALSDRYTVTREETVRYRVLRKGDRA